MVKIGQKKSIGSKNNEWLSKKKEVQGVPGRPLRFHLVLLNQKVELQYSKIELVAIVWAYKNFRID